MVEARTEGEQLLETTEKFIQKNAAHLTKEELMQTAAAMQALQLSLTMDDKDLIHTKVEVLNDIFHIGTSTRSKKQNLFHLKIKLHYKKKNKYLN